LLIGWLEGTKLKKDSSGFLEAANSANKVSSLADLLTPNKKLILAEREGR